MNNPERETIKRLKILCRNKNPSFNYDHFQLKIKLSEIYSFNWRWQKIKSLSARLNHARRLMGWKTVLLWNGIMCICDADLKGEAFGSYQDRREEESAFMRTRAFFLEPIGKFVKKTSKLCNFTWLFFGSTWLFSLEDAIFSRFPSEITYRKTKMNSLKFPAETKRRIIFLFSSNGNFFLSCLPIYPRCFLTAIIKNNMMNSILPHFEA